MPCWCSFEGHKYGRQKPTETSAFEFFCKKAFKYKRFCETIKFSQVQHLVLRAVFSFKKLIKLFT